MPAPEKHTNQHFPITFVERTGYAYASVDELKAFMGLASVSTWTLTQTEYAEQCILGASRTIDNDTNRVFWKSVESERVLNGTSYPTMFVDLVSVSAVVVDGTAWVEAPTEDFILAPIVTVGEEWPHTSIVASIARRVWPVGQLNVAITGVWGFPSVPHPIFLACLNRARMAWAQQGEKDKGGVRSILQGDFRIEYFSPETQRKHELRQIAAYVRTVADA